MPLRNIANLDALFAQTTPDELASAGVRKLNELYRGLLGVAGAPYPERVRKSTERPPSLDANDIHTRITRGLAASAFTEFTQSLASSKARLRIALGLVAVRSWQLAHGRSVPPSLEAAVKEAGLKSVPVDPYDEQPIRFAIVDGQPTVYAVGRDGRDDGGKIDSCPNALILATCSCGCRGYELRLPATLSTAGHQVSHRSSPPCAARKMRLPRSVNSRLFFTISS